MRGKDTLALITEGKAADTAALIAERGARTAIFPPGRPFNLDMRHSFVSSVESDLLLTGVILEGLSLRKFVFVYFFLFFMFV